MKFADLMIAWANGETIQFLNFNDEWTDIETPCWDENTEYRVKPKQKHKHFELIKAYAEGKQIESYSNRTKEWSLCEDPLWGESVLYRIKAEWYENIPPQGILCWVWDYENGSHKKIELIIGFNGIDLHDSFISWHTYWRFAKPLTQEEVLNYISQPNKEKEREITLEGDWFENIPHVGVLCWVSDNDRDTRRGHISVVISYKPDMDYPYRTTENVGWTYAVPLTKKEISEFNQG
jgi:hypothetical protein